MPLKSECSERSGHISPSSLTLHDVLLCMEADAVNAKPLKAWLARGLHVNFGDQVEGGEHIGYVIKAPQLCLQLVGIIWLIIACKESGS